MSSWPRLLSIGHSNHAADVLIDLVKKRDIQVLADVRSHPYSRYAPHFDGFTKREDLGYFPDAILGAEYRHEPLLAPTQELLDRYKKHRGSWHDYEQDFLRLATGYT